MNPCDILAPGQRKHSQTYLANGLRKAVFDWRAQDYRGATETSYRLLKYWFEEDHLREGELYQFWFCQREAIETLIYVYEVLKKRNFIELARDFGSGPIQGYDPAYDKYPLYAFKMATGSGKTIVMVLAIAWSYLNHKFENQADYAAEFLLIAGEKNVIYDRLFRDFEGAKIFKNLPIIPPEWENDFNLKVIPKDEPIHTVGKGTLFLTNIQQLQERHREREDVDNFVNDVFSLKKVKKGDIYQENRIKEVLSQCPNIMILKDEAHHIYSLEKKWKNILVELHGDLIKNYGQGINMELDFSATPKMESGAFFPWTIVDFSLKEAIEMNIVKRPLKGRITKAKEISSTNPVERYRAWIDAGIRRWREYNEKLKPLNKNSILFFQCPNNEEADKIYEYVNSLPDLKQRVLRIHTDSTGEIEKSFIEDARDAAKKIDEFDPKKNPYRSVVSTLMLNEGWDVRNVNIIVGLRSYTSKRGILPEQVIGRGLRKMFPEENVDVEKFVNILEVIGPPGLTEILEELEQEEGLKFGEFDIDDSLKWTNIFVDENKLDKDISLPILTPLVVIREISSDELEINNLPPLDIKLENKILETEYTAVDMVTGAEVIKRKWDLPVAQDSNGVISYCTHLILKNLKIRNAHAIFYPLVKKYVENKMFNRKVKLEDPRVLFQLSSPETREALVGLFVKAFKDLSFEEKEPSIKDRIQLSNVNPFIWSKKVYPAQKCIFNYVPCDNELEDDFAKFLDRADDVVAFAKILPRMGFRVEYKDSEDNFRFYTPDFIVRLGNKEYIFIETKGLEDIDVKFKDKRIQQWCADASELTGNKYKFIRVNQKDFEQHHFQNLGELLKLCSR